jgi:hypothetical protein
MQQVSRPWPLLQAIAVAAALAVVALLLLVPKTGLFVTWYILIPLVPALLLAAPGLWRNLCPIAVVSQVPALAGLRPKRRFPLSSRWGATIGAGVLFLAIVPLRPAIFNQDALALTIFVLSVIVVAAVGGVVYSGKAGWCSSLCPVLPVERLYGQLPIVEVPHAHCSSCDGCMSSCYDLKPVDSLRGLTRPSGETKPASWSLLRTPLGIFAAAFPGFILGYFVLPADSSIPNTYFEVIVYAAASLLLYAFADTFIIRNRILTLRITAATAAGLYYWFTIPAIAKAADTLVHLGSAPDAFVQALRVALLGFVALWFVLSVRSVPPSAAIDSSVAPALD